MGILKYRRMNLLNGIFSRFFSINDKRRAYWFLIKIIDSKNIPFLSTIAHYFITRRTFSLHMDIKMLNVAIVCLSESSPSI
jgi:hypothetical protein